MRATRPCIGVLLLALLPHHATAASLDRAIIPATGGRVSNSQYLLSFSAGLPAIGEAGGANVVEGAGFWPRPGGFPTGTEAPVPFDLRGAWIAGANPFHSSTVIGFETRGEGASRARLEIFDLNGRRVRTLVRGAVSQGKHEVFWDGRDDAGDPLPIGMYLARFESGTTTHTLRLARIH